MKGERVNRNPRLAFNADDADCCTCVGICPHRPDGICRCLPMTERGGQERMKAEREYLDSVIAQSKQRLARTLDLEDALRHYVEHAESTVTGAFEPGQMRENYLASIVGRDLLEESQSGDSR